MKTFGIVAGIFVALVFGCVGGFFIGVASDAGSSFFQQMQLSPGFNASTQSFPANATTSVRAPQVVQAGQSFDIVVDITNTAGSGGSTEQLVQLDVFDGLLQRVDITGSTPAMSGRSPNGGYTSLHYANETVAPGQTLSVKLHCQPKPGQTGSVADDIDVCIGSASTWERRSVQFRIDPSSSGS